MILTNVLDDPKNYKRISISEFNSLTRCTAQHDYLYRQGIKKMEQATYFSKGSYLHSLMEQWFTSGGTFSLDAASAVAKREILEERQAIVQESDVLEIDSLFGKWVESSEFSNTKPMMYRGEPLVEAEFYADIGLRDINDEVVLFHGIIDLVLPNDDGTATIVEHKTASRAWSQVQLQQNYQGPLYAVVIETILGIPVRDVLFNFFYPKSIATTSIYPTAAHKATLVSELQGGVWLRDTGSVVKAPLWGCNGCPVRSMCLLDMQGLDGTNLIGVEYTVDEEKAARFSDDSD